MNPGVLLSKRTPCDQANEAACCGEVQNRQEIATTIRMRNITVVRIIVAEVRTARGHRDLARSHRNLAIVTDEEIHEVDSGKPDTICH